ncbi:MAG TPA: PLP-dependent aminotransferase family protein [Edaphocola sp.]|nr:PLP-dependent aminotransferase family protein [Edaphocola sp.]
MSSPVEISFGQIIKIDRRKSDAVYLQIVYQFINAVQRRILEAGQRIPGSRILSRELGVHRKTIVAALEELQAQGWIAAKPNVGTFVRDPGRNAERAGMGVPFPESAGFGFRKSFILDAPDQHNECPYRFTTGEPDYRIIKTDELARFYSVALKRKSLIKKLSGFTVQGNPFFKKQLSYYINQTKGFHIAPENLLIAQSKEVILYILTQLLIRPQDVVLVGELSYHFSNMVFRQAGATLKTIPMDTQGIKVDFIRNHFQKGDIRVLYVHPQHQYPTTVNLPEDRRQALAELAREYGFVIIEDDTDGELSYEKVTAPPLVKMATTGNVIYLGAFGQFLTPGFQVNFMIAPKDLIEEAYKYLNIFGHSDIVKEQALAEMIHEGDIHRYHRKALKIYHSRRDHFAQLLKTHLPDRVDVHVPAGGLAFWQPFNQPFSLSRLAGICQAQGLFLPRTCLYQNQKITALRLGFGHLNEEEMPEVVKILSTALNLNSI